MDIEACVKCPFISYDGDNRHCYCNHPRGPQSETSTRHRDGTEKNMDGFIHYACPLPRIEDWIQGFEIGGGL